MRAIGKIFIKLLIVLGILTGVAALNTCTPPSEVKKSQMSFRNDLFYFNKYTKYEDNGDKKSTYTSRYEVGSIEMYGNVIIVKKTDETRNFFIEKEEYDEVEQIYTFHCKDATITFDVSMKQIDIHYDGYGGGDVFYINSTIKSNW